MKNQVREEIKDCANFNILKDNITSRGGDTIYINSKYKNVIKKSLSIINRNPEGADLYSNMNFLIETEEGQY